MNIVVFGASKGLGKEVVMTALVRGHTVTAFARHPERLAVSHANLHVQPGDVLDLAAVREACRGQDAAICTLGLPTNQAIGPPLTKRSSILSRGTENILSAMKEKGVQRFICETAVGAGESQEDCSVAAKLAYRVGLCWLFKEKDRQEAAVRQSDREWTIVRPTALTNGPATGNWQAAAHFKAGILTHISRKDVADFIVRELSDKDHLGEAITVSYPPRLGDSLRWAAHFRA